MGRRLPPAPGILLGLNLPLLCVETLELITLLLITELVNADALKGGRPDILGGPVGVFDLGGGGPRNVPALLAACERPPDFGASVAGLLRAFGVFALGGCGFA